jgi:hypothetical protein
VFFFCVFSSFQVMIDDFFSCRIFRKKLGVVE